MSKTVNKAKRKGVSVSVRSRAARRAVSPPLPGKENSTAAAKKSETYYTPATTSVPAAQPQGIRKKKKVQQSRSQKRRTFKSIERAAAIMEQMEVKVARSEDKLKAVRRRRKEWEDVNGERKLISGGAGTGTAGSRFGVLEDEGEDEGNGQGDWEEVEEDSDGDQEMTELPLQSEVLVEGESGGGKTHEEDDDVL